MFNHCVTSLTHLTLDTADIPLRWRQRSVAGRGVEGRVAEQRAPALTGALRTLAAPRQIQIRVLGSLQTGPTVAETPNTHTHTHTHTHTRLMALFQGLISWAGTRKDKPIWILLKHETVSGSGISWAMCKSAPRSRQITMPAPNHSVFYRPDALPATQSTASKH